MLYGPVKYVDLSLLKRPVLIVVIDTEEEFPWHKPHDRTNIAISAIKEVGRVQEIFDLHNVIPCYVIDYAVASNTNDHTELKKISDDGRCIIGSHLHPWVSPPFSEEVNNHNSFPGNLPEEVEFAKLANLKAIIEEKFVTTVNIYKAGRYGIGNNTTNCLEKLGIDIDLSPTPGFNYAMSEGPNYASYSNRAFRFGSEKSQLCLPCTGGFAGWGGGCKPAIYDLLNSKYLLALHAPGIAARLGLVERIRLSPEGYTLNEMKKITRALLCAGEKIFTLSFHSPSVKPGCTPYVRTEQDLTEFLMRIQGYINYFSDEVGGEFMHPEQIQQIV